MDRLKSAEVLSPKTLQRLAPAVVLLLVFAILSFKAVDEGWFARREPLDLSDAPVLLFFNRYKGCECEMVVYEAAERQINEWTGAARAGVRIIPINLDRRPDLGQQYTIIRAPALLLVDKGGVVLYGQKESLSDTAPLDLSAFDRVIQEVNIANRE